MTAAGWSEGGVQFIVQLSWLLSAVFLVYVLLLAIPFARRRPDGPGDAGKFVWHLFIPCRDEEAVIGHTVAYLRAHLPQAHVWVIDDDSGDATAALVTAAAAGDPMVHLVQRRRPDARTGKGHALNAAWAALDRTLPSGPDRDRVIVGVVDADGRPAADCLDAVSADHLFGDPRVGAVQVEVRMVNRHDRRPLPDRGRLANLYARTLVRMQDIEFRVPMAALQLARRSTATVCLGGNGQFTRATALDTLAEQHGRPWNGALLEDYELGVQLLLAGWRNAFCPETYVDQEGLFHTRRYLTQRTRWTQGGMQCARYLPQVWRSRHIGTAGVAEIGYHLAQPWMHLLGTLLYPVPLVLTAAACIAEPERTGAIMAHGGWLLPAALAAVAFAQFAVWGPLYRARAERGAPLGRSLLWGLAYIPYMYVMYLTTWRALVRLMTGRSGWAKTRRNAEAPTAGPVATEA
ncbi:glycosyltransferase [Kitasatospora sp. NBC_01539]|uniref:glycosyltransferase n=1 Tax=Kitasatospora sp. NBC_01539 TaxID=2903577 RepID=UPI0038601945